MIHEPGKSRSSEDVIRGSTNIPLSRFGRDQARERAQQIKRKGGVNEIHSSSLDRAMETAHAVKSANPKAILHPGTNNLHPWHLGALEGQPTKDVVGKMNELIVKFPDRMPPNPASGSLSTAPAESFNSYQRRFFAFLKPLIQQYLARPDHRILLVTHYRVLKLLQAWEKAGFPADFSIDHQEVTRKDGEPGDVRELVASDIRHMGKSLWANWRLVKPAMESSVELQPGIVIERHGFTEWNAENPGGTVEQPKMETEGHAYDWRQNAAQ